MVNSFGKIITVGFAVIVFCLFPIYNMTQDHDSVVQQIVYSDVVEFVDEVREQGKITQDAYVAFTSKLDATGLLYDIEIKHAHDTVVPSFDTSGAVSDVVEGTDIWYTEQILDALFTEHRDDGTEGVYLMSKGDRFSVTVKNREATMNQRLKSSLFGVSQGDAAIYAVYGGVIRDEN